MRDRSQFRVCIDLLPHTRYFLILPKYVRLRANGRDPIRVDLRMALRVVLLDMLKLRRLLERGYIPVQVSQPAVNRRIPGSDIANVSLEMLDVDGVEADDGGEESDVSFGDGVTEEEWRVGGEPPFQVLFDAVEGVEKRIEGFLVGLLGSNKDLAGGSHKSTQQEYLRGKTGFVDAVIDVVVYPFVAFFDLLAERLWEEIEILVLLWKQVIKLVVKHANDLRALSEALLACLAADARTRRPYLIAHDLSCLLVEQGRNRKSPLVFRIYLEVNLTEMGIIVERIRNRILPRNVFVGSYKAPA